MERLPLSSVRTFTVVARLLSISRAADELNVTPSAVSHQIKMLEAYLDTRLFSRDNNKLKLTRAGQQYVAQVSAGLSLLADATAQLKAAKGQPAIRIAAPPSFAALWLIPRLGRFMNLHPEIGLSVTVSSDASAVLAGTCDIAFWYGARTISGLAAHALADDHVFPICKSSLVQGDQALQTPSDLARCCLLDSTDEGTHDFSEPRHGSWHAWLRAAGLPELAAARYLVCSPRVLVYRAIQAGVGVGLSRSLLAIDGLRSKELAVPFGPALSQATSYNVVIGSDLSKRKDVAAFRDWALAEASESNAQAGKFLERLGTATVRSA